MNLCETCFENLQLVCHLQLYLESIHKPFHIKQCIPAYKKNISFPISQTSAC